MSALSQFKQTRTSSALRNNKIPQSDLRSSVMSHTHSPLMLYHSHTLNSTQPLFTQTPPPTPPLDSQQYLLPKQQHHCLQPPIMNLNSPANFSSQSRSNPPFTPQLQSLTPSTQSTKQQKILPLNSLISHSSTHPTTSSFFDHAILAKPIVIFNNSSTNSCSTNNNNNNTPKSKQSDSLLHNKHKQQTLSSSSHQSSTTTASSSVCPSSSSTFTPHHRPINSITTATVPTTTTTTSSQKLLQSATQLSSNGYLNQNQKHDLLSSYRKHSIKNQSSNKNNSNYEQSATPFALSSSKTAMNISLSKKSSSSCFVPASYIQNTDTIMVNQRKSSRYLINHEASNSRFSAREVAKHDQNSFRSISDSNSVLSVPLYASMTKTTAQHSQQERARVFSQQLHSSIMHDRTGLQQQSMGTRDSPSLNPFLLKEKQRVISLIEMSKSHEDVSEQQATQEEPDEHIKKQSRKSDQLQIELMEQECCKTDSDTTTQVEQKESQELDRKERFDETTPICCENKASERSSEEYFELKRQLESLQSTINEMKLQAFEKLSKDTTTESLPNEHQDQSDQQHSSLRDVHNNNNQKNSHLDQQLDDKQIQVAEQQPEYTSQPPFSLTISINQSIGVVSNAITAADAAAIASTPMEWNCCISSGGGVKQLIEEGWRVDVSASTVSKQCESDVFSAMKSFVGVIGVPGSGKTTLINALLKGKFEKVSETNVSVGAAAAPNSRSEMFSRNVNIAIDETLALIEYPIRLPRSKHESVQEAETKDDFWIDFFIQHSQLLVLVIDRFTKDEQNIISDLISRIEKAESVRINEFIVIHNYSSNSFDSGQSPLIAFTQAIQCVYPTRDISRKNSAFLLNSYRSMLTANQSIQSGTNNSKQTQKSKKHVQAAHLLCSKANKHQISTLSYCVDRISAAVLSNSIKVISSDSSSSITVEPTTEKGFLNYLNEFVMNQFKQNPEKVDSNKFECMTRNSLEFIQESSIISYSKTR